MCVQIALWNPVFNYFTYLPTSGIAGSHDNSAFNFWGTAILFSTVEVLFSILSNSAQKFLFLHISPAFAIFWFVLFLIVAILMCVERYLSWFWLAFCELLVMFTNVLGAYCPFYIIFGEMSVSVLCPFSSGLVVLLLSCRIIYILWLPAPTLDLWFLFSPILRLLFYSVVSFNAQKF